MAIQNPQDLFVWMLSDVRQRTEKSRQFCMEFSQATEDPEIKQAIDAHIYVEGNILGTLDEVFKMIGKQPVNTETKFRETYAEDFRRELKEIQAPAAKLLYLAGKLTQMAHMHVGEYVALTAMADITGNYGVGALLETCLADSRVFARRMRRRIKHYIEATLPMRKAA